MTELELKLLVEGFDVDDDAQISGLYENFDATAARMSGLVTITMRVPRDGDLLVTAKAAVRELERVVAGVWVVDLDLDLTDVGEIAERTGKTRQAVNLLATGQRGRGFPDPYALPGGHRIWTWASINRWLAEHRPAWADPTDHLTRDQQRHFAAWLATRTASSASQHRTPAQWYQIVGRRTAVFTDRGGAEFYAAEIAHARRAAEPRPAPPSGESVGGRFEPRVATSAAAS